jgi:cytochrome c oxidase assembly protein subunit 15
MERTNPPAVEVKPEARGLLRAWLIALAVLIAVMVCVGGATRLTDSGLSITEWDPIMGALPPLSAAHWEEAFALYRQIPEYHRVNAGMTLEEFKAIFWWEWGHRNLGRVIGLGFLLPLLWFSARGVVKGGLRLKLWGLFLLVCLQGAIGWYMVASGLSERVDVSQYRLALHLGTALVLFGLVVWQVLSLGRPRGALAQAGLGRWSLVVLAAVFAQTLLGAFVAGLRAGATYNSWPLMDGRFMPEGYFGDPARAADLFERVAAVQFNHRVGAYLLLALALAFAWRCRRAGAGRYGAAVLAAVVAQAALGIWTLLAAVPLWLGVAHQAGALVVLMAAIWSVHALSAPASAIGRARAARSAGLEPRSPAPLPPPAAAG